MWRHLIQRSRTALSDVSGCRNRIRRNPIHGEAVFKQGAHVNSAVRTSNGQCFGC